MKKFSTFALAALLSSHICFADALPKPEDLPARRAQIDTSVVDTSGGSATEVKLETETKHGQIVASIGKGNGRLIGEISPLWTVIAADPDSNTLPIMMGLSYQDNGPLSRLGFAVGTADSKKYGTMVAYRRLVGVLGSFKARDFDTGKSLEGDMLSIIFSGEKPLSPHLAAGGSLDLSLTLTDSGADRNAEKLGVMSALAGWLTIYPGGSNNPLYFQAKVEMDATGVSGKASNLNETLTLNRVTEHASGAVGISF